MSRHSICVVSRGQSGSLHGRRPGSRGADGGEVRREEAAVAGTSATLKIKIKKRIQFSFPFLFFLFFRWILSLREGEGELLL